MVGAVDDAGAGAGLALLHLTLALHPRAHHTPYSLNSTTQGEEAPNMWPPWEPHTDLCVACGRGQERPPRGLRCCRTLLKQLALELKEGLQAGRRVRAVR